MLGKTHVANSTAIVHGAVAFDVLYEKYEDKLDFISYSSPYEKFGFTFGSSFSIFEYLLVIVALVSLSLLLFNIGGVRSKFLYFSVMIFALFATSSLIATNYAYSVLIFLMFFVFGSLSPDIDSPKSTLGKYVKPIGNALPHRTITHTLWAILLIVVISYFTHNLYILGFALGYTMHIAQDTFSKQGICWFYPLIGKYNVFGGGASVKKNRKLPISYRTGGTGETVTFYLSIVFNVLCVGFVVGIKAF